MKLGPSDPDGGMIGNRNGPCLFEKPSSAMGGTVHEISSASDRRRERRFRGDVNSPAEGDGARALTLALA